MAQRADKQIHHRRREFKTVCTAYEKFYKHRPPIPYAHARESRSKTDFAGELIPIQRIRLLANTRN